MKISSVLDIGCGIGGTSIWLSKNYRCKVTGITISPVQAELAKKLAQSEALPLKPVFGVTDANSLKLHQKYDVLWAVEMISHLKNRKAFLTTCAQGLEDKGKLVIADWFKEQGIGREKYKRCIYPIEKGMMVSLSTSPEYIAILENSRLKLRYLEDISDNVKKTWDVCIGIIKSARFWNLATRQGKDFVQFLNAFHSMRRGFASGALRYEVMVFEK
ncbi:methyltransferase domain-containing protein [Candidatus Woesearchaeota archaeon]|nr:methyltransferase domain-containing protein [Candidatus Woesearchaeota archaeon]